MNYTKGPWRTTTSYWDKKAWSKLRPNDGMLEAVTADKPVLVGAEVVALVWGEHEIEDSVNARLIAAAPTMYEALKDILAASDFRGNEDDDQQCVWCGHVYVDDEENESALIGMQCQSDDCPGFQGRKALALAEGKEPTP